MKASKLSGDNVIGLPSSNSAWQLPHLGASASRGSGTRFTRMQLGQTTCIGSVPLAFEQRVETACAVERRQIVESSDMSVADVDLRYRSPARKPHHLEAQRRF